ncbi:SMU1112c/YaeR family gloxylase I-like metalloprotein [Swaminathania salitolerans]|uniref:VOC family protein n=1 Tax=Swaminathania salitolerans TaxID=182838 RepID=A0A511BMW5_9PROT|nr:VOC family protein [Swaminathania salitolerans]GBQ15527.1 lactoylglutathione lyase [Swaminathania salitolerans LMG 21291]GEL01392.1 VOC family protein [Swaminathania salitolerans]
MFQNIHHVAIIASDYQKSRSFYTEMLGLRIIREVWRAQRQSWKCDIAVGNTQIELFSFPTPPSRPSHPEAAGLRHLAFTVDDIQATVDHLAANAITCEPIRTDPYTGKLYTFFSDPDGLPLELYQG